MAKKGHKGMQYVPEQIVFNEGFYLEQRMQSAETLSPCKESISADCGPAQPALFLDYDYGQFVKHVQGYEHEHQRERVAAGRYHCCKYHQPHNGMTAVFTQQ